MAEVGPYSATAPPGTVSLYAGVRTAAFDTTVASSTGDLWQHAITAADASAAFAPLTLEPGQSGTAIVRFTPTGTDRGRVVSGRLDIDTYDPWLVSGDGDITLPYRYTVD